MRGQRASVRRGGQTEPPALAGRPHGRQAEVQRSHAGEGFIYVSNIYKYYIN